jgi:hypothetical protein
MAKVDFQQLKVDAEEMIGKVSEYHRQVCAVIEASEPSRGLATVESALRNVVVHLDRLPEAIGKASFTKSSEAKKTSRLSKPKPTGIKTTRSQSTAKTG